MMLGNDKNLTWVRISAAVEDLFFREISIKDFDLISPFMKAFITYFNFLRKYFKLQILWLYCIIYHLILLLPKVN